MTLRKRSFFLALFASSFLSCATIYAQTLDVWSVDVHDKIFADAQVGENALIVASAASNEYESGQFGIRSDSAIDVAFNASPLVCEASGAQIDASNVRLRTIGTLPVTKNTPMADSIIVRKAPCDMPEILYDKTSTTLKPNEAQGVWITLYVPKGTAPGKYVGEISVTGANVEKKLPLELNVFPFELPDARNFYMTNWYSPWNIASYHKVDYLSERFWELYEAYIKNMGEHRQNVLQISWIPSASGFVQWTRKKDGTFEFDFSNFERVVALAEKYGVADRLELSHIGGIDRTEHTVALNGTNVFDEEQGEAVSIGFNEWIEPGLTALCDYLKKTGRLERAMIHVADEPYLPDVESWREVSARIRAIAPELKQIDAIEAVNFSDRLDVWVPKLSHFDRWRKAFESRRADGEFWYYICCHPYGKDYPNRFMDLPSARIRVLHWLNYAEDLAGYLHWGYNYWQGDAYGAPTETYGPGDTHLVYPGENGPIDSIRWELERESAEDFEYLKLLETNVANILAEYDPVKVWAFDAKSRSMELARRVAPDLAHTTLDAKLIEATRQEIAQEIEATSGELRLVVQTFPEDGKQVYAGSILAESYGITTPGATATINGESVPVSDDGLFKYQLYPKDSGESVYTFVATKDGKSVQTVRRFFAE